jgi:putative restriction endonuclease
MTKGVFTTKTGSGYDDDRTSRYHFPKQYLERASATVGDLVAYYEPRRNGGRSSYFAVVRVISISADPSLDGYFYAQVGDYLDFDELVPFRGAGGLFERNLESTGKTGLSGDFRNAVRLLPESEFDAILAAGFKSSLDGREQLSGNIGELVGGLAEDSAPYEQERSIVAQIVSRPFRDQAFARHVKAAYNGACAITGLSMRNGEGRTEVDAAHIKPVGDGHAGPDSVRNGLALSKTVHWMFDRGLLSVDADYRILTARSLVPEPIMRLIRPDGFLSLPEDGRLRPHHKFLEYHRNVIFKDAKN